MPGTPFVSAASGSWDASATWGNSGSPPVKGTDYPGLAGDVVTITAGHVVKYNVVETNELGATTVNGTWWIPVDQSTKATFGNVELAVGVTGIIVTSTDGTTANAAVVDDAFTCDFVWNTTGDNAKGMTIANGAYVDIRGDSTLYGGTNMTTLAANWSAGQTLTATGTAPLSWAVGQTFTIARNTGTGAATTLRYTIASRIANGGNTDITISEAAPAISFLAGGQIVNEARNVRFYKLGAETPTMSTVYTNRPRISDSHVTGTVKWTDVQITGFYHYDGNAVATGGTYSFTNCISRNGVNSLYRISFAALTTCASYSNSGYGFYLFVSCTLTSCSSYSNNIGFYLFVSCTLTSCSSYSNSIGFHTFTSCTLTSCSGYSNNYGFHTFTSCTLTSCSGYSNTYGFYLACIIIVNGSIGWNGVVSAPNTYDFRFPCVVMLENVKLPQAGLVFYGRNSSLMWGSLWEEHYNQSFGDYRVNQAFSNNTKIASPAGFLYSSGAEKVEPLSVCSLTDLTYFLGGDLFKQPPGIELYLPARQVTITGRIQTHGYTVQPLATELYLELLYYASGGTGAGLDSAKSTTVCSANDTWILFSITVTPSVAGRAYLRGILAKYESGAYVTVEDAPAVDGIPAKIAWTVLGPTNIGLTAAGRRMRGEYHNV